MAEEIKLFKAFLSTSNSSKAEASIVSERNMFHANANFNHTPKNDTPSVAKDADTQSNSLFKLKKTMPCALTHLISLSP